MSAKNIKLITEGVLCLRRARKELLAAAVAAKMDYTIENMQRANGALCVTREAVLRLENDLGKITPKQLGESDAAYAVAVAKHLCMDAKETIEKYKRWQENPTPAGSGR